MSYLIKPANYTPLLDLKQTEVGIKQIKEFLTVPERLAPKGAKGREMLSLGAINSHILPPSDAPSIFSPCGEGSS